MSPLVVENVSFEKNKTLLLDRINLSLNDNLCTILLGPNGAGKSLLMRICHSILKPTSGIVKYPAGNNVCNQAMVFQRPVLLKRSAIANIKFALNLKGVPKVQQDSRAQIALERTGIAHHAHTHALFLSAGEQQRLALARAWSTQPNLLFLDEPTANLDPTATFAVEKIVHDICDEGTHVFMATHDMLQAKRLAKEVVFMHKGQIIEKSAASSFFSHPKSDAAKQFLKGNLLWD